MVVFGYRFVFFVFMYIVNVLLFKFICIFLVDRNMYVLVIESVSLYIIIFFVKDVMFCYRIDFRKGVIFFVFLF